MHYELFQNITVSIVSILIFIGLIVFYVKIWSISAKIKDLNTKIEEQKNILNNKEIKSIKSDHEWEWDWEINNNKKEKQEKRKIEHKIERLEREKKYLLEEISIYKLFKK